MRKKQSVTIFFVGVYFLFILTRTKDFLSSPHHVVTNPLPLISQTACNILPSLPSGNPLWAYQPHKVPAGQHHMTKPQGFRRSDKCCSCVATVHVLIPGDLLHMRFETKSAVFCNGYREGAGSTETIVNKDITIPGGVVAGNNPGKNPGSLTLSKGRT
jgi:hypothetical protein